MDIVEVIAENKVYDKGEKLIKFYSVVMLNYRQDLGDKAWAEISKLFGDESLTNSFAYLMGYATGGDGFKAERMVEFISVDLEKVTK